MIAKVAVWGLGLHATRNILPSLSSSKGIELYGVCSRDKQTVQKSAEAFNCLGWTDPFEMLQDSRVDVVYLSTPIGLHAEHGKLVLGARKHLWCEKPLGANLAQVQELVKLSRDQSVCLAEAFMYLYHPQFDRVREIIDSGKLGTIREVTLRFGIPPLETPGFRNDPALGGGAFLDVGSYPISAAAALFPKSEPRVTLSEIDFLPGIQVDTGGRAVLQCQNNADETPVNLTLQWGINCAYRNEIDLWGNLGSVSTERIFSKPADYVPKFMFRDLRGAESLQNGIAANHFTAMMRNFRGLIDDAQAAEDERIAIVRRAQLADKIQRRKN